MRNLDKLILCVPAKVRDALEIINNNERGVCFVVDETKRLVGVVTDGDIRRSLLKGDTVNSLIACCTNTNFVYANILDKTSYIRSLFSRDVKIVPLVDEDGKLVAYADPKTNYRIPILEPYLNGNESLYVNDCLSTSWISSQGAYVRKFESFFSDLHCSRHALAVSNGTVALHLALLALGISQGDEVILPDLTFAATINSVIYTGATPVLCDIEKSSLCIDPFEAEALITERTKAIILVHLYGQSCDIAAFQKLALKYNLKIIEDCAESLGSTFNHRPHGTFFDVACFSFFGNKTITTGEGGMVLFKQQEAYDLAKQLRDHGMNPDKRYWHDIIGYNYRMTNIQAAIGLAQLEKLSVIVNRKVSIAHAYSSLLHDVSEIVQLPTGLPDSLHSQWLYTVLMSSSVDIDLIIKRMLAYGVELRRIFYPLHIMPIYSNYSGRSSLLVSTECSRSGVSLPSSPSLDFEDADHIVNCLKLIFNEA